MFRVYCFVGMWHYDLYFYEKPDHESIRRIWREDNHGPCLRWSQAARHRPINYWIFDTWNNVMERGRV